MTTERLYLSSIDSAYEKEFTATVTKVEGNKVALDRTLFYPLGGGQNWDLGVLNGPSGQLNVTEVLHTNYLMESVPLEIKYIQIVQELIFTQFNLLKRCYQIYKTK